MPVGGHAIIPICMQRKFPSHNSLHPGHPGTLRRGTGLVSSVRKKRDIGCNVFHTGALRAALSVNVRQSIMIEPRAVFL
jgi:hypothetical protein